MKQYNTKIMENGPDTIARLPLAELTLFDVVPLLRDIVSEEVNKCLRSRDLPADLSGLEDELVDKIAQNPRMYAFGMKGLAKLLHCSERTAYTYIKSGKYKNAIHKLGRRYVVDKNLFEAIHLGKPSQ